MSRHLQTLFLLAVLSFLFVIPTQAQVTTASMSGTVMFQDEPVIGATVLAVHEPSGTNYGTITNVDGRFSLQGMRTGGPYKVTISYVGYQSAVYSGITLQLGENYNLNVKLKESSETLDEIVITAAKTKFNTEKTGATTNISSSQITSLPTINRSISDIARLSPYASDMSFAGGDGRSTNFTVDGANFNNNFGLSDNLPGGGNPISMDAIEEVQVVIAPFDVRQTNFIGGGINAITKSGTNTFKGSAYTYFRMQNYENFVQIQSDAAIRKIAGMYAYDYNESKDPVTLRSDDGEVAQKLEEELNSRLAIAGIEVLEARINYLAYASEIAGVMLRRQQAEAIIAARERIVEGAVSMVQLALNKLDKDNIVELDEERKAAMVSNLLVVLCADEAAQPVVNTGTLHH
ncbi:carboxypeptidase regulatory-like domain-containing protein [Parabacteroides distasonis]|uniref:carboxypeptidase regulatory-like domain-containing protein n=1 Tax=Parabacteroides distasonis TaxID=823 RepID=UPI0021D44169|nr:carboxypeptidase regulatory-like domain-containing protein [Parabacteroides distasonis]